MGSGFSGKYHGTWSSREGEALREQVMKAVEEAGGLLVGDSAMQLAEALVRIAAGESADEVDFPEMSDVALDLALDALSAFVPGGPAVTRSIALAAKAGRSAKFGKVAEEASKIAKRTKELLKDESGYIRLPGKMRMSDAEYAIVNSNLNNMYHSRLKGKEKAEVAIGEYTYTVRVHDFDEYTITDRRHIG